MAKNAEYSIVINGIKESISAVESLNKQLDALEQRMDKLASKNINVSTSGGDGGARVSALDEEAKMLQQIEQLHQKVAASEKQEYQELLHAKEELKEYQTIAKSIAAQTNLSQNINDTSTMMGMKAQLRDLKMAMQTVDVNGDQFKQWAAEANELTQKLKEAEASYGTFSRNVGNYSNGVVNGLKQIVIKVGETERTFASAREASRTLNNELKSLSANGKRGTKEWNELNAAIRKFNNDVAGTSAGLNRVISALQGFTAVASVGRGLSSLFGIDNNEVNQSIQKLVALQGVLQGLQTIQQQLANNKGLGIVFNNAFGKIDQYNFALKRLIVSIAGTGTAARVAAVGVNLLSGAVKGLMSLGVMALITAAIEGISRLGKKIQEWAKGNADLVSSEKLLQNEIDATNEKLQKEIDLINKRYNAGQINAEQQRLETEKAYADAIEKSNEALQKQLELASKKGGNTSFANAALGNQSWVGDKGVTTFGGFSEGLKTMDDLVKRYELLTKAVEKNKGVTENANSVWGRVSLSASDARDELIHLEQLVAGDLVNSFRKFDITTEDGRKQFIRFVQNIQQNGNELQQSVLFRMGDILNQKSPDLANALNGYLGLVQQFVNNFNGETEKLNIMGEVNNVIRSADPTIALKEQNEKWKKYLDEHGSELQISEVAAINKAMDTNNKKIREYGQKKVNSIKTAAKKEQNAVEDTQSRINELRIKLMNDGLQKELRQLDEENRQTINKIKHNSKNVQLELALQEKLYLKQRQELITKSVEEFNNTMAELNIKDLENEIDYLTNKIEELRVKAYPKYSTPFTKEEILKEIFRIKDLNEIKDIAEEIERLRDADDLIETPSKNTVEELGEKYKDEIDGLENKTGDLLKDLKSALKKETDVINKYGVGIYNIINDYDDGTWGAANLLDSLNERLAALDEYDKEFRKRILKIVDERNKERQKLLDKEEEKELAELDKEYFDVFNRLTLTNLTKEEQEENNRKLEEYNRKTVEIEQRYYNKRKDLERQAFEERSRIAEEGYSALLTSLSEFLSKANDLEQKQPVLGKAGFINVKKTKENLKEAEATIEKELMRISAARTKLDEDFANNLITPEAMNAINMQLNDLENSMAKTMESIGAKTKEALPELLRQFEEIFQQLGQAAQQMITAFGDLYDYNIQKELDAIDKLNEELDEKLNEQKEIEERHKNEIESIEDELATSRGDRRQQLIDQLNAEMQARREAAAEQKRIEAEMKANEHKQEELEKKKARAQYRRDLAQILISGAMAAANGFATKPFLPTGLAMGALATTLATAQYLIAKKQKPYAKGGLLEGPSHKHGGIPVGNTGIEVEGKEYVIRKESTAKNVNLLDFINKSKRKLTLSDFIDYYEGRKNKAFRNMSGKYADGGQLPTMPNIDLGDIMTDVAILRDNRPVVVSVVDINRKQDDVRRVQILSGLNPR